MAESRFKRWFGKEHNPKRRSLVRQAVKWQGPADGVGTLGALLWIKVSIFLGLPLVVLAVAMFAISFSKLRLAFKEPHWGTPEAPFPEVPDHVRRPAQQAAR